MRSPFVQVVIKKSATNISEYVKSLKFDDTTEEDSMVTIVVRAEYSLKLLEDENLVRNAIITFQYGFIGDESSPVHTAQIQDIDASYGETVELTIRAKDLGCTLKKVTSIKIWNGVKSEDIVKTIAERYDMEYEVDSSTKVWKNTPQGHKSDFDFLAWLAKRETDGNFIFYVRDNTLYFVRRGLNKASELTYTYGDGKFISFKPKERETTKDKNAEGVSVGSVDAGSGQSTGSNSKEEKNGISTGEKSYVYNANTAKTGDKVKLDTKDGFSTKDGLFGSLSKFGGNMVTPSADTVENNNIGNSKKKSAGLEGMTADLVVEGNPFLFPNKMITMSNVAKRHSGNWFVSKVTHNIDGSGNYTTTLGLKKNGGKVGDEKSKNPVNKTIGKDANSSNGKTKTTIKKVYDSNTVYVADRSGDVYLPPNK